MERISKHTKFKARPLIIPNDVFDKLEKQGWEIQRNVSKSLNDNELFMHRRLNENVEIILQAVTFSGTKNPARQTGFLVNQWLQDPPFYIRFETLEEALTTANNKEQMELLLHLTPEGFEDMEEVAPAPKPYSRYKVGKRTAKTVEQVRVWIETTGHFEVLTEHKGDEVTFAVLKGHGQQLRVPTALYRKCFIKGGGEFDNRMYRWDHAAEFQSAWGE